MIGFYNYSVIVTYIGVALSVSGMALASTGQFKFAIYVWHLPAPVTLLMEKSHVL